MAWQAVAAHWKANSSQLRGSEHTWGFMVLFHLSPPHGPQLNSATSVVPHCWQHFILWLTQGPWSTPFLTQVSRPHPPPKNEKQEREVHRKHSSWHGLGSPGEESRVPLLWCTTWLSHTLSHRSGHSCVHSYFLLSWASGCQEFSLQ